MIEQSTARVPLVGGSAGLARVQQAVWVSRTVTHKKTDEVKTGQRVFLSSLAWEPGAAASSRSGRLVSAHWTVENNMHWLRDGVWKENSCPCPCPNAACALALLRTALLAPVRARGAASLPSALDAFTKNKVSAVYLIRNQRLA